MSLLRQYCTVVRGVDSATGHVTSLRVEERLLLGVTLRPSRGAGDILPRKGGLGVEKKAGPGSGRYIFTLHSSTDSPVLTVSSHHDKTARHFVKLLALLANNKIFCRVSLGCLVVPAQ